MAGEGANYFFFFEGLYIFFLVGSTFYFYLFFLGGSNQFFCGWVNSFVEEEGQKITAIITRYYKH